MGVPERSPGVDHFVDHSASVGTHEKRPPDFSVGVSHHGKENSKNL